MRSSLKNQTDAVQRILQDPDLFGADYITGVANLKGLLPKKYMQYPCGISIGRKLDDSIIDDIAFGPTSMYYEHYRAINEELAGKALCVQRELDKEGIGSVIIQPTVSIGEKGTLNYLPNLTVDVSHKMVATRAGLGWIGKTDLLISFRFGPRLRLVSILVDRDPGNNPVPVEQSRCGNCTLCIEKCPAQAATGAFWSAGVHRDLYFDAYKCREMCGRLAKERLNANVRICGICVSVCPIGRQKNKRTVLSDRTYRNGE